MNRQARRIQRVYLLLTLLSTTATSLIWGINTLFLLDAGLDNTQAFAANGFFTAGMLLFEIPTGVVADTRGRRTSFLMGAATLLLSTLLYLLMWQNTAPFWGWALASLLLGLGYTFFSGAVEAWLVDALASAGYTDDLETVFARGTAVSGVAMLGGSVAGGFIAQAAGLGVPYLLRAVLLGLTFLAALVLMRDLGFTPGRSEGARVEIKRILQASLDSGWRNRPVKWLMLAAPFTSGVMFYAFYAMQPYLLELYGDDTAFGIAGLGAAIVAGAQIVGGMLVPQIRRAFKRRTHALIAAAALSTASLLLIGLTHSFWTAILLLTLWAVTLSAASPMRQAFINGLIPSRQRATVLSFDSLMGSAGGTVAQPLLGRTADLWGYSASYLASAVLSAAALPFYLLARHEDAPSDPIAIGGAPPGRDGPETHRP